MGMRQSSGRRTAKRRVGTALVAVALATGATGAMGLTGHALADGVCGSGTAGTAGVKLTCTYTTTGSEQTFAVPAGVTSLHVVAVGGKGGAGYDGVTEDGQGARVSADITVVGGSALYVEVGGNGGDGAYASGGDGGYNGGGSNGGTFRSGGGGGASDVRSIAAAQSGSLAARLVVAGGAGGSGYGAPGGAAGGNSDGSGT